MLKVRILGEIKTQLTPIQKHNANFLMNTPGIEASMNELDVYDQEDYYDLVKGIRVLSQFKITKFITGESYGKVFKLNNDHVFKMFVDSVNPKEDMAWYKKCYDSLHSGEAKPTTLPVHDYGVWQEDVKRFIGLKIYWVEMAEVMPVEKWIVHTGRDRGENILRFNREFEDIVNWYELRRTTNLMAFAKWLKPRKNDTSEALFNKLLGRESKGVLTKKEIIGLLTALEDLTSAGFKMKDIFPRNIGVLKQSRPDKPIFIIFDN